MASLILNKSQEKAIIHNKGAMLVLAGPGSGKTTVIVNRVNYLITNYNINPEEILVITFTKLAAEEMKERFEQEFKSMNSKVFFGTFHSYFFKIIRQFYNYSLENILKETEKIGILKKIIYSLKLSFDSEEEFVQSIISNISLLKNEIIEPELYNPIGCRAQDFLTIFYKYENTKKSLNKIDFDDMLIQCYNLLKKDKGIRDFWTNKYKYILIDEFQDINKVQYECIKMLVNSDENIFVVGDDDQSIYKFRGSRSDFLLNFSKDFKNSKKAVLNINYRSTDDIISVCNSIIKGNKNRFEKNIIGTGKTYKKPILIRPNDTIQESKFITMKIKALQKEIPLEEIAIIYRTNIQAMSIIENLRDSSINYQVKDTLFSIYDHWITKDILSYLILSLNKNSNENFIRIVNKPKRYIGKDFINHSLQNCDTNESLLDSMLISSEIKTYQLEKLHSLKFHLNKLKSKNTYKSIKYIIKQIEYEDYLQDYADFKGIKVKGLLEIAYEILESSKKYPDILTFIKHIEKMSYEVKNKNKNSNKNGVVLSTMHSVKGLEFDTVFIIGCIEGNIPHEKCVLEEDIDEERRLFYVGITRAKKLLYISAIKNKYEKKVNHSRFLNNLIKTKGDF